MCALKLLFFNSYYYRLLATLITCCLIQYAVTQDDTLECDDGKGECKVITDCPPIAENYELLALRNMITYCMTDDYKICCPKPPKPRAGPSVDDKRLFVQKCAEYNGMVPCGHTTTKLIVNGVKAEPKEFPHMALLGKKMFKSAPNWLCGATLISEKFVATAAHCVPNYEPEDLVVRLGELDHSRNDEDAKPQDFDVFNIVPHPNYGNESFDIALIELQNPTEFSVYIKPACLPWTKSDEYDKFLAAGWGNTGLAKRPSSHLLSVPLTPFPGDACDKVREDILFNPDTEICAGSQNDTGDTCQGDSGGPLFVKHPVHRCMFVLVGITSTGLPCGQIQSPAVYTRVHLFTKWIQQIVWDSRPDLG